MKRIYLAACVVGLLLPLSQFVPWLAEHSLAPRLLIQHAFAHPVSAFAWLDVIVTAVVVLLFIYAEGGRWKMKRLWAPSAATLCVGPSLGLPLFLLMRANHMESAEQRK